MSESSRKKQKKNTYQKDKGLYQTEFDALFDALYGDNKDEKKFRSTDHKKYIEELFYLYKRYYNDGDSARKALKDRGGREYETFLGLVTNLKAQDGLQYLKVSRWHNLERAMDEAILLCKK